VSRKAEDMPEPPRGTAGARWMRIKLYVEIREAAPNPMFTRAHRELVRFLHYNLPVKCAECGKARKRHWTMLCSFQALDMGMLVPQRSGKVHLPLAPVCGKHLLAAETEEADPPTTVEGEPTAVDPDVAEARARKAEADRDFELKLADARERFERKLIVDELVRREEAGE
jgi:hypothetical protein